MNREIKRLEYWLRDIIGEDMVTADEAFIQFSERGVKPDFSKILNPKRYHQLQDAKMVEGWHVDMYEQGVLERSVPYWVLLGGTNPKEIPPLEIAVWMSKQLFKGKDSELIMNCYKQVIMYWTWWRKLIFSFK